MHQHVEANRIRGRSAWGVRHVEQRFRRGRATGRKASRRWCVRPARSSAAWLPTRSMSPEAPAERTRGGEPGWCRRCSPSRWWPYSPSPSGRVGRLSEFPRGAPERRSRSDGPSRASRSNGAEYPRASWSTKVGVDDAPVIRDVTLAKLADALSESAILPGCHGADAAPRSREPSGPISPDVTGGRPLSPPPTWS